MNCYFCCCFSLLVSQDWSKSDERLLEAVRQNEPDKVAALIGPPLCCLEVILAHGPDINVTDGSGETTVSFSEHVNMFSVTDRQGEMIDSIDSVGQTALHHAAVSGCLSCTETLWDFKARLDAQDGDGVTPLILGAQMSRVELCAFLLDRGANPNIQDSQGRMSMRKSITGRVSFSKLSEITLGHDAAHYGATAGNQRIAQLLQNGAPSAEKLLSRRSRESPFALDEGEADSPNPTSPGPADPDTVAELYRQVDELTSQNQELVLTVQMLEMFEKDDTDMQTSGPDFVPTALYDSIRREFEALQERYSQAQASAEASSMAGEV
ncbi:unnamed protein product, partial [Coregonus sp. 'balchen']